MRGRKPGTKSFRYTDEHLDFLKDNVSGTPFKVLAEMFNERFGTDKTYDQIVGICKSHGLKNGLNGHVEETRAGYHWTDEQVEYLKEIYHGKKRSEIVKIFNDHFGLDLSFNVVVGKAKRLGLKTDFHPVGCNKGCKVRYNENSAKHRFKPGQEPHNVLPVGTERKRADGYKWKKVDEKKWIQLHRMIWEQANGKIPEGKFIIFLNGDRDDCRLENLSLIDQSVHMEMNRRHYYNQHPEITRSAINIANLNVTIKSMEKVKNEREQ